MRIVDIVARRLIWKISNPKRTESFVKIVPTSPEQPLTVETYVLDVFLVN